MPVNVTGAACASSQDKFVNVAADFTSVVASQRLVRFYDECEIRRYIHNDLA
jgi:hypothetical protein